MSTTLLASYVVQAAGALFTAVLFGFFSRTYRKPFLLHWARSWSAMCVMLAGAALGYAVSQSGPPTSATRLTLSGVTAVAGYLQVAWLLLGCAELASFDRSSRLLQNRGWVLGAAVALGISSVALFANHPDPLGPRFFVRVAFRS